MKKFLCVAAFAAALTLPFEAFAKTDLKDVLTDVGVNIIKEAIKNPGTTSKKTPDEKPTKETTPNKRVAMVRKLSDAQYNEFVEICKSGSVESFEAKLENENISPNARYSGGMSDEYLLNIAALNSPNADIVNFLLDKGIDVNQADKDYNWTALLSAVCRADGNLEIVETLIDAGADVNASGGDDGSSVLMFAAKSGTPEVVKFLIDSGAKVNPQVGTYNFTALIAAAVGTENPDVIVTLLNAGADAKLKDKLGKRAIDYARQNQNLKGTKALKMLEDASAEKKAPAKKTGGKKSTKKKSK